MSNASPGPMRSFDPRRVGRLERDAWAAYYRREWPTFLRAAVGMVAAGFGMPWWRSGYGAALVLRANQKWAPYPANDAESARRLMTRFYALVARTHGEPFDAAEAARLEVEWWRVHRTLQRERPGDDDTPLVDALSRLYAYVYGVGMPAVRPAAVERAAAMRASDRWVAGGCGVSDPLLAEVAAALVRSYAALLAAVHRPSAEVRARVVSRPRRP